jgi:hypothetical protein
VQSNIPTNCAHCGGGSFWRDVEGDIVCIACSRPQKLRRPHDELTAHFGSESLGSSLISRCLECGVQLSKSEPGSKYCGSRCKQVARNRRQRHAA